MSNFWADKLGGSAPPPHVQQQPSRAPQAPWWAPTPASPHLQVQAPAAGQAASMPHTYDELKRMRADEMSQEQMELLAEYELQADKYQQNCPHCGAGGFIKQGDRVGGIRFGTDRCFECGAGASTLTMSPEPAAGVTGNKAASIHTRQTANGGLQATYGHHHTSLPASYLPRGS